MSIDRVVGAASSSPPPMRYSSKPHIVSRVRSSSSDIGHGRRVVSVPKQTRADAIKNARIEGARKANMDKAIASTTETWSYKSNPPRIAEVPAGGLPKVNVGGRSMDRVSFQIYNSTSAPVNKAEASGELRRMILPEQVGGHYNLEGRIVLPKDINEYVVRQISTVLLSRAISGRKIPTIEELSTIKGQNELLKSDIRSIIEIAAKAIRSINTYYDEKLIRQHGGGEGVKFPEILPPKKGISVFPKIDRSFAEFVQNQISELHEILKGKITKAIPVTPKEVKEVVRTTINVSKEINQLYFQIHGGFEKVVSAYSKEALELVDRNIDTYLEVLNQIMRDAFKDVALYNNKGNKVMPREDFILGDTPDYIFTGELIKSLQVQKSNIAKLIGNRAVSEIDFRNHDIVNPKGVGNIISVVA